MRHSLEPTGDCSWIICHEGYNSLTESQVESRLAFGNGFLGMRAARSAGRGPSWVSWLGFVSKGHFGLVIGVARKRNADELRQHAAQPGYERSWRTG